MRNAKVGLSVLTLLVSAAMAEAGDWAHWRGPEMNGISREKGLVDHWSFEDGTNVLWTSEIGGRAAPIVLNGRVYLNCRTHHDVTDPVEKIHSRDQVVCWDAATGELLWKDEFNVFQTDIPAPRVGWASMVGDPETGNVYVHAVSGIFRCYAPDGTIIWEYSLFEEFGKISGYGGRTVTPLIDEDQIILNYLCTNWGESAGPPKDTYYSFDKRTGKLLWTTAVGGAPEDTTYSNPVIAVIGGVRMLINGGADGGIHALQARTGEHLWSFYMSKRGLNATPVVEGDMVYISHGEDNLDSTEFGRVQCIDGTGRGDITATHSVWRKDGVKAGYTALLVKDGMLYVTADTGNLHAFDAKTGDELWVHNLGTVGKGSPVWADGKIYVMEVNGNIHILKPSREGCESLSHVELTAAHGAGMDEIYASPAIADGRIYLVTRDRTICLGTAATQPASDPIPELPAEAATDDQIAKILLVPFEARVMGGGEIAYELRAYDKNGRFLKTLEPKLEPQSDLPDATADGGKLVFGADVTEQAGHVVARHGDLTAQARVRVFPALPWSWDFSGLTGREVPPTWVGATLKLLPTEVDGDMAMRKTVGKGKPSANIWLGPPEMSGYTIQADVLMREEKRRLPGIGLVAQRYNLILKGNTMKVGVQSWAPHLRMAQEVSFRSDPDVWYTMKLRVDIEADGAHVRGKVWERDKPEPEAWTIETVDPHPNQTGSPGLYVYALAECLFDNVKVMSE